MKKEQAPPFITCSDPCLSQWQSAVSSYVHKQLLKNNPKLSINSHEVRMHPMVQATNIHVREFNRGKKIDTPSKADFKGKSAAQIHEDHHLHSYLSQQYFEAAVTQRVQNNIIPDVGLPYSDSDLSQWAASATEYGLFHSLIAPDQVYYDWSLPTQGSNIGGNGDINFGVIDWVLPANAKVVILGDYGTGEADAIAMLSTLLSTINPDCIIHIGDIYYAGMDTECQSAIVNVFQNAFNNYGKTVPVFSIPGNHEYMGGIMGQGAGSGFYTYVLPLNNLPPLSPGTTPIPAGCTQQASYFCLRTADSTWQFLGMDTGFYSVPWVKPELGPPLHPSEVTWLQDKLENFGGNTIMLSHHQLFSANATINGTSVTNLIPPAFYVQPGSDYLNDFLLSYFRPFFNKISAWFWGHEHALGIFQDGLYGLSKGRLVGNSGYEEETSQDPFTVNNPLTPYSTAVPMPAVGSTSVTWPYPAGITSTTNNWINHTFAVIDFSNTASPQVNYYDYPVWVFGSSQPSTTPALNPPIAAENLYTSNPYFTGGWNTGLPGTGLYNLSNIVMGTNNIIYASANGTIFAMDPVTGNILNGNGNGVPIQNESSELRLVVANNMLYACSARGYVYALSLDTSTSLLWTCDLPQSGTTNIIYGGNSLYAGFHGDAAMLDPNTGTMIGDRVNLSNADGEVRLAMDGDTLYAGVDGNFFVFEPGNFQNPSKTVVVSPDSLVNLLAVNGYLYAGVNGTVYCYDGNQNLVSQNNLVNGSSEVRLASDGNNLYAGTNGYLISLNLVSLANNSNWSNSVIELPESQSILDNNLRMICNNGYIFIGCFGNLFKVDASNGTLYPGVLNHGYEIPIVLNGNGICAIFTGNNFIQNYLADNAYPGSWVSFVSCVSQDTLT